MLSADLKARAVLAPTMLLFIGLIYWADRSGVWCASLLLLLGVLGAREFVQLLRSGGFAIAGKTLMVYTAGLLAAAFPFGWAQVDRELYPPVVLTLLLLFPLAVRSLGKHDMRTGLERQGATLLGFLLVAWPMYFGMGLCLRHLPSVLYVVLVCKVGDIGGYCLGRLLGRTKLIPHISPGKTVEGALGSLLASVALAIGLRGVLLEPVVALPWWGGLLTGIGLNFTTQTGDLIESLLKRRCNAKDSGRLLPAHGGVLDLIDSLLFSFCLWFLVLVAIT